MTEYTHIALRLVLFVPVALCLTHVTAWIKESKWEYIWYAIIFIPIDLTKALRVCKNLSAVLDAIGTFFGTENSYLGKKYIAQKK